ncbi:MAG: ammonium transporter [Rhodospirillaceae bacterium]|nr:ammonium transporter [Rhodospirillaceae bacterium]MYH38595.1 ammonium transporter [Rhodospirillaceae bacterium]MYK13749.1 ammonium transporter [Rhodospirillaceae bacterium]MYK57881.1 ammonium transporter [Rhodospirillaceae bacterium]
MQSVRNLKRLPAALAGVAVCIVPGAALAADKLDSGDTAWMLTATALVLLMTIPGLALFYGGMVRKKNVLSVLMQVFAVCCVASIVWVVIGYSIAFGGDGPYIGGFSQLFLAGIAPESMSGSIPESVFAMFQMTFAIITPALIVGAFVDRMKFSAMLLFTVIWLIVVYAPICHWVWGSGGWIGGLGALDFAGGTVVHINSGVAALVAAIVVGKRLNYGRENMAPHNLTLSVIGAALLWVGWFGFNAGSALTAGTGAGFAMLVTQLATAVAALAWTFAEWMQRGKPSVLGIVSGAVAGLVAITPASGFVGVLGAIVIGLAAGLVCYWASTSLKHKLGYDDSLDVFGIHGVGGIVGALLTGVFATRFVTGGEDAVGWVDGNFAQILPQIYGVLATIVWTGVLTVVILVVVRAITGLRVSEEIERGSLDLELHGETVQ